MAARDNLKTVIILLAVIFILDANLFTACPKSSGHTATACQPCLVLMVTVVETLNVK